MLEELNYMFEETKTEFNSDQSIVKKNVAIVAAITASCTGFATKVELEFTTAKQAL